MKTIGHNLFTIRRMYGISIRDMAEFLGVDEKTVWDYQKGCKPMTADQIEKCSCLFDISDEEFMTVPIDGTDSMNYTDLNLSANDLFILADIGRIARNVEYMEDLIRRVDCQHCC